MVGNHIESYADNTTIYAVISRPLSHPQVMESLNHDLAEFDSCLKYHIRLNPKKTKSVVVNCSRTNALDYGELPLGGAELKEVKSLSIF